MNIAFFTEGNWNGRVDRTHPNMRTDLAWQASLNSFHYPIGYDSHRMPDGYYDLGIYIVPKKKPVFDIPEIKRLCKSVAIMQEGPRWYWQDWDVADQFAYMNLINSVDRLYVHNESDRMYYLGLVDHQRVYVLQSLMVEDPINTSEIMAPDRRSGVMIGGNFVSWYGGFDSYVIAHHFDEQIYCPSMGRKTSGESLIDDIIYLDYMQWNQWIIELSKCKYGVHLMRTHAAGTFALNCAYLGIPCIGYRGLDTQEKLHPLTSVDDGDMVNARAIANLLKHDAAFYNECSNRARANYHIYYREEVFLTKFKETL